MLKSFMHHSMAVKAAACRYTDWAILTVVNVSVSSGEEGLENYFILNKFLV
jgi:hypothetical protein